MFGTLDALWRHPDTLTTFLPLPPEREERVRQRLAAPHDLRDVEGLHFLRAFVIDARDDLAGPAPTRLVVNAVFDGPPRPVLEAALRACPELRATLTEDAGGQSDPAGLAGWLVDRSVRPELHYLGPVRVPLATLREERALHDEIQAFLDARRETLAGLDAGRIRDEVRAHVQGRPGLPRGPRPRDWHLWPLEALGFLRLGLWLTLPSLAVGLLLGLPPGWLLLAVAVGTALTIAFARALPGWLQRTEPDHLVTPDPTHVARLLDAEDHGPINAFTMLTAVRPTRWRRLYLRFTLYAGQLLVRHVWRFGKLVGVDTIHTARIHQLDGGRRMLFMSDFDGSWDRYLFDFLTTGAFAVVPIWTNHHGCPPEGHPAFAERFLPFTRACQLRTDLWYAALPDLTMSEILRNARVRRGLFGAGDPRAWLELL